MWLLTFSPTILNGDRCQMDLKEIKSFKNLQ